MNVTREALRAARARYTAAVHEYAAAGQDRLELFSNAVAAGWDSLEAATELGIPGLFTPDGTDVSPPGTDTPGSPARDLL
ncbi:MULTISPECIES: hypothetical protein [unclassified Nocardia]|uniref:hypothetical protein n=1 Tax=unclassified Nocardia TaxID=2637762 RepID=UPI0024A9B303|nr:MULTISPECIES: hypothetical protein [unclassified Nocardia]